MPKREPGDEIVAQESHDAGKPVFTGSGRVSAGRGPGVVEVQFRDDVSARVVLGATPAESVLSGADVDLSTVHAVLSRHGLDRAEPSFAAVADVAPGAEGADAAQPAELAGLPHPRNFVRLHFPAGSDLNAIASELVRLPQVERAVPDPGALPPRVAPPAGTPLDEPLVGGSDRVATDPVTRLDNQWYLFRCRVDRAWGSRAGEGVVIADIDWGYRTSHRDLANLELERSYNSVDGSRNVSHGNSTSHGTAVLGIAGAALNGQGLSGVAPRAALWAVQANSGAGKPIPGNPWANAIEHVRTADSGGRRKVIVLEVQTGTFGNYESNPAVNLAIRRAIASNVVVCVAAGNGDRSAEVGDDGMPIPETGSILVGATSYDPDVNRRASFSNYGNRIVVAAPGDPDHDVTCSIAADTAYQNTFGGTSGATPKVAGTVALMLAENPGLTHAEVRDILRRTGSSVVSEPAKPLGTFLNADAAVREARQRLSQPPVRDGKTVLPFRIDVSGRRSGSGQAPGAASIPPLRAFLATAGRLSRADRLLVVDQALLLLEQLYVHRPLKEAMHAVRPTQRLRLLRHQLEQTAEEQLPGELQFHNEMSDIFISLRDLHTNYLLPDPYRAKTAFLPFLVEEYFEPGSDQPRYVVSKVIEGFSHPTFGPGVEVLYWNGVPIRRAVELSARASAGSNREARRARGVDALTIRPLAVSLPPDAEWVDVGYRTADGTEAEFRQDWLLYPPDQEADAPAPADEPSVETAAVQGIDIQGDEVRRAKQILFAPETVQRAARVAAERAAGSDARAADLTVESAMGMDVQTEFVRRAKQFLFAPAAVAEGARNPAADGEEAIISRIPSVLNARAVATPHGVVGYIRVYTFSVEDADAFVAEFVRLARLLPREGLIVDVRGNGGGLIHAGERLLQVLTPRPITPEPVQFINSPSTLQLCRRFGPGSALDLSSWTSSIEEAVTTGATYSRGFPITSPESCNALGQKYTGPVVLITDARCYSTTDIFAAGFQDHEIGVILGVSGNTGAGGANVWTHDLLRKLFSGGESPFQPLPSGAGMRVAIRQTVRVGPRSGTLLEDLGVVPDQLHRMTREDVLNGNEKLIERAAAILAGLPRHHLSFEIRSRGTTRAEVVATARGLDRLDFFIDGRPRESLDVSDGDVPFEVTLAPTGPTVLLLQGYRAGELVAACREEI